ncbi:hypothetical protein [Methanobrevibacter sp.]|uniref:hypothetical protein n=1 Tax=Methanobrevibacter sp. TaxID=66852 RepID=UPI003890109E
MKPKHNVHSEAYKELKSSSDPTENEMAEILNNLRVVRNNADYDDNDEYDLNFFIEFLNENNSDFIYFIWCRKLLKKASELLWGLNLKSNSFVRQLDCGFKI